jgi:hypothetical protein
MGEGIVNDEVPKRDDVRYIDKTRDYYRGEGYEKDYQWARFEEIPFTPLTKPLSQCRLGLVTTAEVSVRDAEVPDNLARDVYALSIDTPIDRLYSRKASYDKYATTLEDVNAFLPITPLRGLAAEGRIAGLASRFQVVYSNYSQRRSLEIDAPEVLRQCREDGVDAVLLAAV